MSHQIFGTVGDAEWIETKIVPVGQYGYRAHYEQVWGNYHGYMDNYKQNLILVFFRNPKKQKNWNITNFVLNSW